MGDISKIADNLTLYVIEAAGGMYNSEQLQALSKVLEEEGIVAKVTEDQRFVLALDDDQAGAIGDALLEVGLTKRPYREGMHQPVACLGSQCSFHDQDALGDALAITGKLSSTEVNAPFRIGINGCAQACVPTHTLDISLIGEPGGYRISIGGKNTQIPEMAAFAAEGIPAAELPELMTKLMNAYQEAAEDGEDFHEVIERAGMSPFIAALAPYSQDAADDSDPFGSLVEDTGSHEPEADGTDLPNTEGLELDSSEIDESEIAEEDSSSEDSLNEDASFGEIVDDDEEDRSIEDVQSLAVEAAGLEEADDAEPNQISAEPTGAENIDVSADAADTPELNDEVELKPEIDDACLDIDLGDDVGESLNNDVPIAEDSEPVESDLSARSEDGIAFADELEANSADSDISDVNNELEELDENAESLLEDKIDESIAEQVELSAGKDQNEQDRDLALSSLDEDLDDDPIDLSAVEEAASTSRRQSSVAGSSFGSLSGVQIEGNKLKIALGGANLNFDLTSLAHNSEPKVLNLNGQTIEVRNIGDEVSVTVDGVELVLNLQMAA